MDSLKYFFLIFFTSLVLCCKSQNIVKEKFLTIMPIELPDSSVEIYKTDFNRIAYKDLVLYELPFRESFAIEDSIISDTIKYEYFIFNINDKYGYLFRNITDSFGLQKKIDSILVPRAHYNLTFDSGLKLKNKHEIKYEGNEKIRVKFFSDRTDSVITYFNSEFKNLQYSLAPQLDEALQSKLYKVEYWSKDKYRDGSKIITTVEVRLDKIENEPEIRTLFKRFEQYYNLKERN